MKKNISIKILREFGFLISFTLPILIGWLLPAIGGHSFRKWTLWIGIISLLLTFFNPNLLSKPYRFWMKIGYYLGWINSRLILGLVYLIILQPIAIVMKIFGYDPLKKKKSNEKYYREIRKDEKSDFTRIF